MSAHVTSYLDAIAHLPSGATLTLTNVSWEEYEQLLQDLGEGSAVRVFYDHGWLEIVSPTGRHERSKDLIAYLVRAIADELEQDLESFGSTTFKEKELESGGEPDTCFYLQTAARVKGNNDLDLKTDPPPDVVVEVDVSHSSEKKLAFYRKLRVPEIWRYDGRRVVFYHLTESGYVEASASRALPLLTPDVLLQFLQQGEKEGQTPALRAFRKWVRQQLTG
ncbi:MAG: hypothetical protein AUH28_10295 [Acidobacteria bacterium 13_1_40CM_56_16]|nr:MAG: hypothetical protein AUH28_10295 [Acidobacteria bacterium 13_1_40CM_56_16]OLD71578.1 MAG: hypothetical protein AUI45_01255 [Acidobacteria bacterium 13_1_40CM_2_56_11]